MKKLLLALFVLCLAVPVSSQVAIDSLIKVADNDSTYDLIMFTVLHPDTVNFSDSVIEMFDYRRFGTSVLYSEIKYYDSVGSSPRIGLVIIAKEPPPEFDQYDVNHDGKVAGVADMAALLSRMFHGWVH